MKIEKETYKTALDKFNDDFSQYMSSLSKEDQEKLNSDFVILNQEGQIDVEEKLPNPGIKVGEKAPNFTLNNPFGKKITLDEELKKGPVILVFYRGAWCPFCNMHLHALQESMPMFEKYNAQLIAVTPQNPEKSEEQITKDKYSFEVLSDLDSQVIKEYNLYYKITENLVTVLKGLGFDVEAHNGKGRHELPVPGTFVIDQEGIVQAMHAPIDYTLRMEPSDILSALESTYTKEYKGK